MARWRGFTLVELMVVVAIIGILAAIAIPNYVALQLRAKRSELPTNVQSIKVAELGYDATNDGFVAAPIHPRAVPDKALAAWTTDNVGYESLGWRADAPVRGVYSVEVLSTTDILVTGISDCDGDGVQAMYSATAFLNAEIREGDISVY